MPEKLDGVDAARTDARNEWSKAAHDVLIGTSRICKGWITYEAFGNQVQDRTGITTNVSWEDPLYVGPTRAKYRCAILGENTVAGDFG